MMWPFKKKKNPNIEMMSPDELRYSQLDITEAFGDNTRLALDEWVATVPLNELDQGIQAQGLPPADASHDEVYSLATTLSQVRESVMIPSDGVYCPVCHIANAQLERLRTPCPKCRRPLLRFGWD
jgi:hypothetical protein